MRAAVLRPFALAFLVLTCTTGVLGNVHRSHASLDVPRCTTLTLPPLPYPDDAFVPHISAEAIRTHYQKHQGGYVATLSRWATLNAENGISHDTDSSFVVELIRKLPKGTTPSNLASQIFNHALYFQSLRNCSPSPCALPDAEDPLMTAIVAQFGSFEQLKHRLKVEAASHFGSGWVWLLHNRSADASQLVVVSTHDAETPIAGDNTIVPLIVLDVWEHAYYIDYRQDRAQYFENWFAVVDWVFASARFTGVSIAGGTVEYMEGGSNGCYPLLTPPKLVGVHETSDEPNNEPGAASDDASSPSGANIGADDAKPAADDNDGEY